MDTHQDPCAELDELDWGNCIKGYLMQIHKMASLFFSLNNELKKGENSVKHRVEWGFSFLQCYCFHSDQILKIFLIFHVLQLELCNFLSHKMFLK